MGGRVDIAFSGQCSAHGGDGRKGIAVSFECGRGISGVQLDMKKQ